MKNNRIYRALALAVTLALLVVAIPMSPVLAAEDITLDPDEGKIGDRFYVEGDGFEESDTSDPNPDNWTIEEVDIYITSQEADEGDDMDDEITIYDRLARDEEVDDDGDFKKRVTVPDKLNDGDDTEDVVRGTYYICVTYDGRDNIEAVAEFTVLAAEITINPDNGVVGTEVTITGVDFDGSKDITIEYDGAAIDIESGDTDTDSDGDFSSSILIPESTAGEHTIKVTDESFNEYEAVFTVEPKMSISATSGMIGDSVTISGTGFDGGDTVTVTFGGDSLAQGTTNTDGTFSVTFVVPGIGPGPHVVEVKDEGNNSGSVEFTIATEVSVSPVTSLASPGFVGMDVTISGIGFIPNHQITITYTSTPVVFTTTSGTDGSFSYTFEVPASDPGSHTITATDGTTTLEVDFVMESVSPPIPQPLLPEMDVKAEQPVLFDWMAVEDPSGVTYSLQVAKDRNFTAPLVLEQEGLTETEYTVAEEMELESTKKDEPYWWRIKAVDGAGNESGWSGAGAFHVGFAFDMPNWAIYLLIGVGGVLLFFVGFFVGRKTGYEY
jgi:hypothetical protein